MGTKSKLKGLVACTKAQFDALPAKNADKIYLITDDEQGQAQGSSEPIYVHVLNFTDYTGSSPFYGFATIITKSATPITSLDGIKAVLGNTFYHPCCAYYEDTNTVFFSMSDMIFQSNKETTTKAWTGISISDKVRTA